MGFSTVLLTSFPSTRVLILPIACVPVLRNMILSLKTSTTSKVSATALSITPLVKRYAVPASVMEIVAIRTATMLEDIAFLVFNLFDTFDILPNHYFLFLRILFFLSRLFFLRV